MSDDKPVPVAVGGAALPEKPARIWVTHCLFKKNGFPSLGTFGATERPVVILPLRTWEALCREIPELAKRQFEVGSQD